MQLLDSGNLVVRDAGDENPENFFWQSFDYPTDTYLPGMKMGINFETGHEVYLSAWKSAEDPSPSEYTSNLLVTGYPQGIIRQGKALICRSGPWNGVRWSGIPSPDINPIYNYVLVINKTEIYTNYSLVKKSVISVLYMNYTGVVHRLMWMEGMRDWITIGKLPTDDCDRYGNCGGNGLCNIGNFPVCGCLDHFLPRNQADWGMAKFAGGCVRKKSLECHTGKDAGGFLKYSGIKVPDTQNSWYNETMTLQECQQECLKNCSCTAFSSLDVRNGGSGCLIWFGDLVDIRQMSERGQDIYIRLASSELGSRREHRKILEIVAVSLSAVAGLIVVGLSLVLYVRRKKKTKFLRDEDFELPVFHLRTIARATNNFSADNKLGEGGFGPVYKGVLENGQEIAVKRLSKASVQGIHEFKNEVVFIAKLQHRNLKPGQIVGLANFAGEVCGREDEPGDCKVGKDSVDFLITSWGSNCQYTQNSLYNETMTNPRNASKNAGRTCLCYCVFGGLRCFRMGGSGCLDCGLEDFGWTFRQIAKRNEGKTFIHQTCNSS
nr:G-type lectin S-receptor-like serine/threonine-protein kinase At4g27290 [Ipomoea batatas]